MDSMHVDGNFKTKQKRWVLLKFSHVNGQKGN